MLSKRQKLAQAKFTSLDTNRNQSIVSMFARQRSNNNLQNAQMDNQHIIGQPCLEVTDRPQVDNRLSLSGRRKRACAAAPVIDLTDDADNNNTPDISEPCCTSTDHISSIASGMQNNSLPVCNDSVFPAENIKDIVPYDTSVSSDEVMSSDFAGDTRHLSEDISSHQNDSSTFVTDNSISDPSLQTQNANDTKAAYAPYYLENFLLTFDSVFNDTFYADLFSDDDLSALHAFKNLNGKYAFGEIFHIYFHVFMQVAVCIVIKFLIYI